VNDTIGRQGRQRRSRLPRTGLLAVAVAVIALLATACGSGSSSSATPGLQTLGSLTNQALAYAKCMRAQKACEPLLPDGGP